MKRRNKLKRFLLRCKIALRIIFKEKHGVVLVINRDQLTSLITHNEINEDIQIAYFGMMEHHVGQLVKIASSLISDVDIICSKAEFEIKATENKRES